MNARSHQAELGHLLRRLVEAGIVDGEAAVDGRVSVTDLSRSHPVGLVEIDDTPVAVVKGRGSATADDLDAIAREEAAYRWLSGSAVTARLAPSPVPGAGRGEAMVTRPVVGATSLHQALGEAPGQTEVLIAEVGRLLAVVHTADASAWECPVRRPWILDVPAGRIPAMYDGNLPAIRLVEQIAQPGPIAATIADLDREWAARAVIHGDVKFDNILVTPDGMFLVDWELAGPGDPAWDLAGVVDGLLLPLLLGGGGGSVDRALVFGLAEPALAAHRAAAGPTLSPSPERVGMAVVARLAQTATQLAAMGLDDPDAAAAASLVAATATALAEEFAHAVAAR